MPAKKKNSNKEIVVSSLVLGLRETIDPLVKALDQKPALMMDDSADTGSVKPSAQDSSLKILLGQILQTVWRQQYGLIKTRTSQTIMNNDQRLKKSESDYDSLTKEVEEGKISMDSKYAVSIMHWFGVNEARFDACSDLLGAFNTVYRETFNEEWKPLIDQDSPTKAVDKTSGASLSPEEQANYLALLDKAKARAEARKAVA